MSAVQERAALVTVTTDADGEWSWTYPDDLGGPFPERVFGVWVEDAWVVATEEKVHLVLEVTDPAVLTGTAYVDASIPFRLLAGVTIAMKLHASGE